MLSAIHPKLPMRSCSITKDFYINLLGFEKIGTADYEDYLMLQKDAIELHFFKFSELNPLENYGQVYIRTNNIEEWYRLALNKNLPIPAAGHLAIKPWQQQEFSLLDPDHNLLTFGQ